MTGEEREAARIPEARQLEMPLSYAPRRTLLSGWVENPEVIAGRGAWVTAPYGEGRVHLFGFQPQYRGWSQQASGMLMRALFLNGAH
jgi:hypothetical protein